jgi:hypothetical protein
MNKYQQFAVNHYLQKYNPDMNFDTIIETLLNDWDDVIPFDIYESNLSLEEIADSIVQMASDLEKLL